MTTLVSDDRQFIETLTQSDAGREMIRKAEADAIAAADKARAAMKEELDNFDAITTEEAERLDAALQTAAAALDRLRPKWSELKSSHIDAVCRLQNHKLSTRTRRDQLIGRLVAAAPPELAAFVDEIRRTEDGARSSFRAREIPTGRFNEHGPIVEERSNTDLINLILDRCKAARDAVRQAILDGATSDEAQAIVRRLRASINGDD